MTAPTSRTATYSWFKDKHGRHNNDEFITDAGNLHYDPNTAQIRLGDGKTPGGVPIGVGDISFDLSLIYNKAEIDQFFSDLRGTANTSVTLGSLGNIVQNNTALCNNLSNQFANIVANDTDDQSLVFDAGAKTLDITDGNQVLLDIKPKPTEYLRVYFPERLYTDSLDYWPAYNNINELDSGHIYVPYFPGSPRLYLDPNRTYKIVLQTEKLRFKDAALSANKNAVQAIVGINFQNVKNNQRTLLTNYSYWRPDGYYDYQGSREAPSAYMTRTINLNASVFAEVYGEYTDRYGVGIYMAANSFGPYYWSGWLTIVAVN